MASMYRDLRTALELAGIKPPTTEVSKQEYGSQRLKLVPTLRTDRAKMGHPVSSHPMSVPI
jgi:hypothetical protein